MRSLGAVWSTELALLLHCASGALRKLAIDAFHQLVYAMITGLPYAALGPSGLGETSALDRIAR